jgi:ubiquinone/menaquinone biosynthesis C-methylase UbiE/uncharacterized protein YbaR (Trm112 family)
MDNISQHKSDFENIYRVLPGMKGEWSFRFPLEEIESFDWNRGKWANDYYHYFYRRFSSHILSRLLLEDNQKILVVGCGFGFDEKNIKALNKSIELWSIDISEEMIKRAIRNQTPSHFLIGIAEKLPFPDRCFDRVLAREVIEHVLDPKAMLQEIGRVLKVGGRAVVTTENYHSLTPSQRYERFIKPNIAKLFRLTLPKPSYMNQAPSTNKIRRDAEQAGLTLFEFFWDGALYKYLPKWAPLLKTKLTRIAHFFSCLENHSTFARAFCDQVKFIFLKKEQTSHRLVPCHEVFLVCPVCKIRLDLHPGFYTCPTCQRNYYFTGDLPNFLLDEMRDVADPNSTSEGEEKKYSLIGSGLEMMFKTLNLICHSSYEFLYVGLSVLTTFVAEKNYPYLSHTLSKKDRFQQYIKIDRRG